MVARILGHSAIRVGLYLATEDGVDIAAARPKLLDAQSLARADRIITMGRDVEGVPRIDDDWGLTDPKGQPREGVGEIRDTVKPKLQSWPAKSER